MKKLINLITAAALLFSITACDELSDLMQITFENVEIEEVLDIPLSDFSARSITLSGIAASDTSYFSDTTELSLDKAEEAADTTIEATEEKLADYLNKLTSVTIKELSFELLDQYNGNTLPENFEIVELNLEVTDNNDIVLLSETFNNIVANTPVFSSIDTTSLKAMGKVLKDNEVLTIKSSGATIGTEGIDYFELKALMIADIKAGL